MIAGNRKIVWPRKRRYDESYWMKFNIRGVEVLNRRQARNRPCHENWEDYDNVIKNKFTNAIGCRLPYLDLRENISICNTKEKMNSKFYLRSDDYGVNPPCRQMEKVTDLFEETSLDTEKYSWARKGSFLIEIIFPDEDYKEITKTR